MPEPTLDDLIRQAYRLNLEPQELMALIYSHFPRITTGEVVAGLQARKVEIDREIDIANEWRRQNRGKLDRQRRRG
jgi:hypothetical protein